MKVALLSFDFGEYCVRLADALAEHADVLLLLPDDLARPYLSLVRRRPEIRTFVKPRLRAPASQLRMVSEILRSVRRFDPDVLHLQQGHLWFNLALPLLRRYPLVVSVHDPRHHEGDREARRHLQSVLHLGFRRADELIVHGQALMGELSRIGLDEARMHTIPHILLGDGATSEPWTEGENVVLFLGRIWPYKGLEYLVRAEPIVSAQVPDVEFVIAGRGEDFTRYRSMMVHPDRFVVHNRYVSDAERADLLRRASCVVLPYVDASQSGVIPLAYAFSKPVVATTVGALPEMVDDGRTGLLVPPRNEVALADAVVRLLQHREERHQMGRDGKAKLERECAPPVVAAATMRVYTQALQRSTRALARTTGVAR